MVTPGGFYLLFFGIGALLVGTLVGLDVIQSAWMSWLLFSGLSIGSPATLTPTAPPTHGHRPRRDLAGRYDGRRNGHRAGRHSSRRPGQSGMPRQHGTRTTSATPLTKGQRSLVHHVDGITLWIKPE